MLVRVCFFALVGVTGISTESSPESHPVAWEDEVEERESGSERLALAHWTGGSPRAHPVDWEDEEEEREDEEIAHEAYGLAKKSLMKPLVREKVDVNTDSVQREGAASPQAHPLYASGWDDDEEELELKSRPLDWEDDEKEPELKSVPLDWEDDEEEPELKSVPLDWTPSKEDLELKAFPLAEDALEDDELEGIEMTDMSAQEVMESEMSPEESAKEFNEAIERPVKLEEGEDYELPIKLEEGEDVKVNGHSHGVVLDEVEQRAVPADRLRRHRAEEEMASSEEPLKSWAELEGYTR